MNNNKIKCLNIGHIFKTTIGAINGSLMEGNIGTTKKVTLPDGKTLPYVSGQSIKYMMRRKLEEMGHTLSSILTSDAGGKGKAPDVPEGHPEKNIDDDLFGFMIAVRGGTRRRTAPVRVTPAVGIFPYRGDRDFGTKSKEQTAGSAEAGGNIFETEIYYNFFRGNILIEIDRVGEFLDTEIKGLEKVQLSIPQELKRKRLYDLITTLENFWGGGRQSRFLTDLSPKFIIFTSQTKKIPIFLESLFVNEEEELLVDPIVEVLSDYKGIINNTIIGIRNGIFSNEDEIRNKLKNVMTIGEALSEVKNQINQLEF